MLWWCLLLCIFSKAQAQPYVIGLGLLVMAYTTMFRCLCYD